MKNSIANLLLALVVGLFFGYFVTADYEKAKEETQGKVVVCEKRDSICAPSVVEVEAIVVENNDVYNNLYASLISTGIVNHNKSIRPNTAPSFGSDLTTSDTQQTLDSLILIKHPYRLCGASVSLDALPCEVLYVSNMGSLGNLMYIEARGRSPGERLSYLPIV